MPRRTDASRSKPRAGEARKPDDARVSPFARYQGIGNPGIPSGRKNAALWVRRLRRP